MLNPTTSDNYGFHDEAQITTHMLLTVICVVLLYQLSMAILVTCILCSCISQAHYQHFKNLHNIHNTISSCIHVRRKSEIVNILLVRPYLHDDYFEFSIRLCSVSAVSCHCSTLFNTSHHSSSALGQLQVIWAYLRLRFCPHNGKEHNSTPSRCC